MDRIVINPRNNNYEVSEEIKSLRTNLQFCGRDRKVILVTSCLGGEGKSTIALNLAISLAELQKKVLLVDADLRKSVLLRQVRKGRVIKGLSHFLSGQAALTEVIYLTDVPRLQILFSGPIPPNPSELLSQKTFKNLLVKSREIYDYVIVDCAPLGMVIDAAIVAESCDGAIMTMEAGTISYHFAQSVKNQLEKSACPVLGVVLNKVDRNRSGRYYGKNYKKYYGKYEESLETYKTSK